MKRHPKTMARKARPLTPDETRAWVRTYGRHARLWTWIFFVLVLGLIFGLIRWEMGEVNADVLYSFGFVALLTFLLACWSRKSATRSWVGVVEELRSEKIEACRLRGRSGDSVERRMLRVRLPKGRVVTLRLSPKLYAYFHPGERIFKVSGLEWPEKVELDRPERVCLACGCLYLQGAGRCGRCGAPEPDHPMLVRLVKMV